jgi:hypothetical protein
LTGDQAGKPTCKKWKARNLDGVDNAWGRYYGSIHEPFRVSGYEFTGHFTIWPSVRGEIVCHE